MRRLLIALAITSTMLTLSVRDSFAFSSLASSTQAIHSEASNLDELTAMVTEINEVHNDCAMILDNPNSVVYMLFDKNDILHEISTMYEGKALNHVIIKDLLIGILFESEFREITELATQMGYEMEIKLMPSNLNEDPFSYRYTSDEIKAKAQDDSYDNQYHEDCIDYGYDTTCFELTKVDTVVESSY
jgi:hypothetical protein